jgi:hypothetical protein
MNNIQHNTGKKDLWSYHVQDYLIKPRKPVFLGGGGELACIVAYTDKLNQAQSVTHI